MYLKRAPASSGRAVLRCGMSWGPNAAGGSLAEIRRPGPPMVDALDLDKF